MLQFTKPDQLLDFANRLRVIKLKDGAKLPLAKRGMFILLTGNMRIVTHWQTNEGFTAHQKAYQSFIYKQLGRMEAKYDFNDGANIDETVKDLSQNEQRARSSAIRARKTQRGVEARLMANRDADLNYLEEYFKSNVYLSRLKLPQDV